MFSNVRSILTKVSSDDNTARKGSDADIGVARPEPATSAIEWCTLALVAFAGPIVISLFQKGLIFDDPFILMRYGQHLAQGVGWNFNYLAHTDNAVTSPLYVALIAGGVLLGGSPLALSIMIYVLAWGAGGVVLARILFWDNRRLGGWLGVSLYSVSGLLANVHGMETSLYLLLILGAIYAYQRERWIMLGTLLALLMSARSDGILLAGLMLLWIAVRQRMSLIRTLIPFAVLSTLCYAGLWIATKTVFPTTLSAKLAQRDSGRWGGQEAFLQGLGGNGIVGLDGPPTPVYAILGLLMLTLAAFGSVTAYRERQWGPVLLSVVALTVGIEYGVGLRMPSGYLWHYGPWALGVVAGMCVGLDELARRGRAIAAIIVVPLVAIGSVSAINFKGDPIRIYYHEVAEWINNDSRKPRPTVAAMEIGAIGYYSRADMVDYLGLLDKRAIDSVRHADFTWWLTVKPDYWLRLGAAEASTLDDPRFQSAYLPAAKFGPITVYRRITPMPS